MLIIQKIFVAAVLMFVGGALGQTAIPGPASIPNSVASNSWTACDFDNDGSMDILVDGYFPKASSAVYFWGIYSNKKQQYLLVVDSSMVTSIPVSNPLPVYQYPVLFNYGDFDGDGKSEVLWNNKIYKYGDLPAVPLLKKN